MSRCKWFSTVITILTRYASPIYRICTAIKTQWIPHWKHLPEHLQEPSYLSGVKRPAGWWLAGELSSNFLSNRLCWDSLASPKTRKQLNLQVEATYVELIPRSSRDANYAIKRCCSPSYFPFSDYIFQIPLPSSKLINANCDPDFSYIKFCPFLDKTVKYILS